MQFHFSKSENDLVYSAFYLHKEEYVKQISKGSLSTSLVQPVLAIYMPKNCLCLSPFPESPQ